MDAALAAPAEGFGQRLSDAIGTVRISESELARKAMLSRWTIRNWIAERTRPEMAGLRRVANVLGVKAEDLLGIDADSQADEIDSVEKFFVWLSQVQYQITINARKAIDCEVARKLADHQVGAASGDQRRKPAKELVEEATAEVMRDLFQRTDAAPEPPKKKSRSASGRAPKKP